MITDMAETLRAVIGGGAVLRYHTAPTLGQQGVAEHSFGVAWLVELITDGTARKELIMAALAHDLAEQATGDIPSPAKHAFGLKERLDAVETEFLRDRDLGYSAKLSDEEKVILHTADMLEGLLFCVLERHSGNLRLGIVYDNFRRGLVGTPPVGRAKELFGLIETYWRGMCNG